MSELLIDNVLQQFKDQNNGLLNDLIKCEELIDLLEKYRICLIEFNNNCNCDQNINNKNTINLLENEYKNMVKRNEINVESNDDKNGKTCEQTNEMTTIETTITRSHCPMKSSQKCVNNYNHKSHQSIVSGINILRNNNKTTIKRKVITKDNMKCVWPGCEMTLKTSVALDRHTDRHRGVKRVFISRKSKPRPEFYYCQWPECVFKSNVKRNVRDHYIRHTGERKYGCHWPGCESKFYKKCDLDKHLDFIHNCEKKYFCDITDCGKAFKSKDSLKHHSYVHSGGNPFICHWNDCDKTYPTKSKLETHLETHSETDKYFCCQEFCRKSFKTKQRLLIHRNKMHSELKTFVCDWAECSIRCDTSEQLERHKKAKHLAVRKFKCVFNDCGQAFADSTTLRRHTNRHFK